VIDVGGAAASPAPPMAVSEAWKSFNRRYAVRSGPPSARRHAAVAGRAADDTVTSAHGPTTASVSSTLIVRIATP